MLVLLPLSSGILVIIFLNQLVSKNLQIVYTDFPLILFRSCYNEAARKMNTVIDVNSEEFIEFRDKVLNLVLKDFACEIILHKLGL